MMFTQGGRPDPAKSLEVPEISEQIPPLSARHSDRDHTGAVVANLLQSRLGKAPARPNHLRAEAVRLRLCTAT